MAVQITQTLIFNVIKVINSQQATFMVKDPLEKLLQRLHDTENYSKVSKKEKAFCFSR